MAATPQELAALNGVIQAVNQILSEAQSINDHPIMSPINLNAYGLFQVNTDSPERVSLQNIINEASNVTPTGSEGDVLLKLLGNIGTISGFNYDSLSDTLNFPMSINTRGLSIGIVNETVDFEGGDLTGTGFTVGGDVPFFVDTVNPFEGVYSLRSGIITGNQKSEAYKTITVNETYNVISFALYTDTEKNGDVLYFFINKQFTSGLLETRTVYKITNYVAGDDFTNIGASSNATGVEFVSTGTTPANWTNGSSLVIETLVGSYSGLTTWGVVSFPVSSGTYELKWSYVKDPNGNVGTDKVQIDLFQTAELIKSSTFNGLNVFNDINIFNGNVEFSTIIGGVLKTVNDIVINGLSIGQGGGNNTTNIVIDSAVNKSGALLNENSFAVTAIGANVLPKAEGARNISVFGSNTGKNIKDGQNLFAVGNSTLRGIVDGVDVVGLGRTTSDLPSNLSNTFFVNIAGTRFITINSIGAELPTQTAAAINSIGDFAPITRKYFFDNMPGGGGVQDAPDLSVGNTTSSSLGILVPTGDATQPDQTSGTLIIGRDYLIKNYVAGDNFTNVGAASNATNVYFTATGTTPATWTNGSTLTRISSFGYNILATMLEANEDLKTNNAISYKDITNTPQSTFLDEVNNKFLFPSNLNTFANTYVTYFIRTTFVIDLSAVSNQTTRYYLRLRRVSNNTIIAQDQYIYSDFPAVINLPETSEIKTFVDGETDPFVVDGCYLDILSDSNSAGTVTLQNATVRIFTS